MFKKQIKKLQKITKFRIFPVIFLSIILASQVFFVDFSKPQTAEAQAIKFCTYYIAGGAKQGDRNIATSNITFSNQKYLNGDQSLATGFDGEINIEYETKPDLYSSDLTKCGSNLNKDVHLVIGTSNVTNSKPIPLTGSFSQKIAKDNSVTLTYKGTFSIPDLTPEILPNILATEIKDTTKPADYKFYFYTNEYPSPIYHEVGNGIKLIGCDNPHRVCASLNGSNPTITDPEVIPLEKMKIFGRLNALKPDFVAGTVGDTQGQNFYRTYKKKVNNVETIEPIDFGVKVIPDSPADKTLVIDSNSGKYSSISFKNESIPNKKIFGLGLGFFNEKVKWTKGGDIGCVMDSFGSDVVATQNEFKSYLWCQFEPKVEKNNGISYKMNGSEGLQDSLTINSTNLTKLVTDIKYLPDTCKTGEGNCPVTQEYANVVNYSAFISMDPNPGTTTGGASFPSPSAKYTVLKNYFYGIPFVFPSKPIYIVIYPNEEVWKEHKNEPPPDWVPEATDAGGTAQVKDDTPGNSLYAFIVRVISGLIVWLQSIIYAAFAYILVPILNALLRVHPYQDTFVNIIYPGWLILRNLANIFFIVSLLVVGLKILFQQSAAGATRSLILRLVIMALLVNFSLVIAQGVVGIADTVQSQFLPGDTRIIESLGQKLMVEPLKNFREEVAGKDAVFKADEATNSLADTIKPLILLVLTVAAFFSFVALAAFLLVRLVVLWVLYMTSPIAYVGYVMDETKTYAKQWWKEFFKYVILTPVLVFFLNIAALMATLFSGQNNTLFNFSKGVTDDIVIGALTIISHFIVLFFIYAGMKFALSSGTIGSKTIVDYAQKGFNNTLNKWPRAVLGGTKDALGNMAAKKLEDKGYAGAAKALTAAVKPFEFGKAVKKAQWDDRGELRKKQNQERLNDTFLTRGINDTSKIGSSLKKAREKMKELEGDTPAYLSEKMGEAFKKKDRDGMSAAMLKMGQEGQFKDILDQGSRLMGGKKYSKDAAGLNAMTEDMVSKGALTADNRRDLLDEFDKSAKKKRSNGHYGGNVYYDPTSKKFKVRDRAARRENNNSPDYFSNNQYANKDSHLRAQIKARTGDDPKGSLRQDLSSADVSTAVTADNRFTEAQAAVFAEQDPVNLRNSKIWDSAMGANPSKMSKMREAWNHPETQETLRNNMIQYFNATHTDADGNETGRDPDADRKAQVRMAALSQEFDRQNNAQNANQNPQPPPQQPNNRNADGTTRVVGFNRNQGQPNNQPQPENDDEDEDEDDDEENQASDAHNQPIRAVTNVTSVQNPISSSISNASNTDQPLAPRIGDTLFREPAPQVGKVTSNVKNDKPVKDSKPESDKSEKPKNRTVGFIPQGYKAPSSAAPKPLDSKEQSENETKEATGTNLPEEK